MGTVSVDLRVPGKLLQRPVKPAESLVELREKARGGARALSASGASAAVLLIKAVQLGLYAASVESRLYLQIMSRIGHYIAPLSMSSITVNYMPGFSASPNAFCLRSSIKSFMDVSQTAASGEMPSLTAWNRTAEITPLSLRRPVRFPAARPIPCPERS